jgi:WD40 repeat protein
MRRFRLLLFVAIAFCIWLASTFAVLACLPCLPRFTPHGTEGFFESDVLNFSPDGRTLAIANHNADAVQLWDVDSGRLRMSFDVVPSGDTFGGPSWDWPTEVPFSPDGGRVAFRTRESLVICEIASGRQVGQIDRQIVGPVFSPDGQLLAGRTWPENEVKLWNFAAGEEVDTLPANEKTLVRPGYFPPANFRFSPRGDAILFDKGETENRVALWGTSPPRGRATLKGNYYSHSFSPDGAMLALCDQSVIRVYDVPTGEERLALQGDGNLAWACCFLPGGRLASIRLPDTKPPKVQVHDLATGCIQSVLEPDASPDIEGGRLTVSRDGRLLLWEGRAPCIDQLASESALWEIDADTPRVLYQPAPPRRRAVALGSRVAVAEYAAVADMQGNDVNVWLDRQLGRANPRLRLVDLATIQPVATVPMGRGSPPHKWRLSPDERTLAVRSSGGAIVLYDVPPRKPTAFAATLALIPVAFLVLMRYARRVAASAPAKANGQRALRVTLEPWPCPPCSPLLITAGGPSCTLPAYASAARS